MKRVRSRFPPNSPGLWILHIVATILLAEGIAVIVLSSHFGPWLGVVSIAVAALIFFLVPPKLPALVPQARDSDRHSGYSEGPGVMLVEKVASKIGGTYSFAAIGLALISSVILYNALWSDSPDYGDSDTLSILFGCCLVAYPFVPRRYRAEGTFALIFIGLTFVILVIPQLIQAQVASSRAVGWYVHYMLAAPMSALLRLMGIDASSAGEFVTIISRDGQAIILGISVGCAGLYSFAIFVSAFVAFVLVFERLTRWLMIFVLVVGVLIAYLGNLVRMVIIGVVGYHCGVSALLWAHDNVGFVIFLTWSSLFWYVVMRYAEKKNRSTFKSADA